MELHLLTKKNTFLLFCLVVVFGTGCFKFNEPGVSQNITWVGNIREKITKKPVPNAAIYLYRSNSDFDVFSPSSYSIVDTFYAQKDGSFSFTYFDDVDYLYVITAGANKYYTSTRHGALGTRTSPHVDIELDPYAWIKFHVKNVNPFDDNDMIYIDRFKPLQGRVDTFLIKEAVGNSSFDLVWIVSKDKIENKFNNTISELKAHDTTYFEIKY